MGSWPRSTSLWRTKLGFLRPWRTRQPPWTTLAQRTNIPRRTLRILADAMVALGFVERQGDLYQNSVVASTFLSGRTPADLRPALRYWNRLNYHRWTKLEEAVRTDQAVLGSLRSLPRNNRCTRRASKQLPRGRRGHWRGRMIGSRHRRILDLGGGTGSFLPRCSTSIVAWRGRLYDLPAVAALARQQLAESPLAARLRIVEGDFFTDPLPEDHDAILLANVVHNFLPERNRALLRRLGASAPAAARLLLVDFWTDPLHTQPLTAALMAGAFLLTSQGDVYSAEEVRDWLLATGWRPLEHKVLAGPASLIVAEKAA